MYYAKMILRERVGSIFRGYSTLLIQNESYSAPIANKNKINKSNLSKIHEARTKINPHPQQLSTSMADQDHHHRARTSARRWAAAADEKIAACIAVKSAEAERSSPKPRDEPVPEVDDAQR